MAYRSRTFRELNLIGDIVDNTAAGTTADIKVLMRDSAKKILLATGTDVPTDATTGYAKGCIFIDTDVATGISGKYENVGTSTSCNFDALTATAAEINAVCDGNTATAVEIIQGCDLSAQESMTPGAGFIGSGSTYDVSTVQHGSIIKTSILLDIEGGIAASGDTLIIGGVTSGVAHIGQMLTLQSGTILGGQMTCLETPGVGEDDIDLYSATVGTGQQGTDVTDLTETVLLTSGAAWAAGGNPITFTGVPAADEYLYLTTGDVDAGTYTAGRFLIEMWGI